MEAASKKLLMVIPINDNRFNDFAKQYVSQVLAPDFSIDVVNIEHGEKAIQSRLTREINARYVIDLIRDDLDSARGYSGVFISDFDGCALECCRELLEIPVVDGFRPQAAVALDLAQTFSILTPKDTLIGMDVEHPRSMGIGDCLASIRALDISVSDIPPPNAQGDVDQRLLEWAVEASCDAIFDDGAQAILLGCTALVGLADPVARKLADMGIFVPVLDPNLVAVAYLQTLVRCGLVQSKRCYPTPGRSPVSERPSSAESVPRYSQIRALRMRQGA